jgi:D-alanyl-D-alanine carboxypeptidase
VHRDGRYIVAVVLGGRSAFERDAHMRELINAHIKEASLRHTAPVIAEKAEQGGDVKPVAFAKAPPTSHTDPTPTATVNAKENGATAVGSNDPIQPVLVKTITYRTAPMQPAALAAMPNLVPTATLPRPPGAAAALPPSAPMPAVRTPPAAQAAEGPGTITVASAEAAAIAAAKAEPPKSDVTKSEPPKPESPRVIVAKVEPVSPQVRSRGGWQIQIGAFEGEDEAKQHLNAAQLKNPAMLAKADPFTERVQKGDKALYRARFAGFDKAMAEAACRQLKRSDITCMTVKD